MTSHYVTVLQYVYNTYLDGSKSMEEIVTLVSKKNGALPKLARMFYSLVKKYDQAIHHVDKRSRMKDIPRPTPSRVEL